MSARPDSTICASLALAGLLLACLPAAAQAPESAPLGGLSQMTLSIERLSEDGEKCLLSQEDLTAAINENISGSGITLAEGNHPTLYVQVNTAAASELCYSSVTMNVHYYAKVPHPKNRQGTIAQIMLWNDSYLVSSEKTAHPDYVRAQIKSGVGFLIADWQKQNGIVPAESSNTAQTPVTPPPSIAESVAKTP